MKTAVAAALIVVVIAGIGTEVASACGDKFLAVGRGVRFQRAYAAIHPASILIVLPAKNVKTAAVRDSRLVTALKMAGHRVQTVQQPSNLADAFARAPHDIVLVEKIDASAARNAAASNGQPTPAIISVFEPPAVPDVVPASAQFEYVLKTPQTLPQILNLLDDVMKARRDNARRTGVAVSGE
jgi:vacuolar-type H+-ATPase subunit F/Vma7